MAASYATAENVATRLKVVFDVAETAQAVQLLRYVAAIMRKRVQQVGADLDAGLADGSIEADLAEAVCVDVAILAISVTSAGAGVKSETHPEYSITFTDAATAGLDLTAGQIELLTPTPEPADTRGRAFNIHPR